MKVCKIWAVVAVYLLEKGAAYFDDIFNYVKETDITELGARGKYPEKTVRSVLIKKKIHGCAVFQEESKRYFSLYYDEDEIKEHREVKLVYQKLKEKENIKKEN